MKHLLLSIAISASFFGFTQDTSQFVLECSRFDLFDSGIDSSMMLTKLPSGFEIEVPENEFNEYYIRNPNCQIDILDNYICYIDVRDGSLKFNSIGVGSEKFEMFKQFPRMKYSEQHGAYVLLINTPIECAISFELENDVVTRIQFNALCY
jgi:hypothetical protein